VQSSEKVNREKSKASIKDIPAGLVVATLFKRCTGRYGAIICCCSYTKVGGLFRGISTKHSTPHNFTSL
jgi:hypothetical protein